MEHAPLRPVPARPTGPVDPVAAAREVAAVLPALEPLEARALALVALADRPRAEVAGTLGIEEDELGSLLAAARKELRQTITPLAGSGWCERAEGLISDRLDGAVREPDARRLDVHLRNCPRCVEHERRLVQATDALLAGIAPARPGPAPPGPLGPTPAPLGPVGDEGVPVGDEGVPVGDEGVPVGDEGVPVGDDGVPEDEALKEGASGGAAPGPDAPGPDAPGPDAPGPEAPGPEAPAPAERIASGSPRSEQIAAAAEVLVTARTRRQLATAVTWNVMIAVAVILTVAAIALTLAGILGAEL